MQHAQTLRHATPVAALGTDARAAVIWRTYGHLAVAILAFGAIESYLFDSGIGQRLAQTLLGVNWLLVIGAFIFV